MRSLLIRWKVKLMKRRRMKGELQLLEWNLEVRGEVGCI